MPEADTKIQIGDYGTIMNDRNIFNQIVYTPLSEALRLLDERRKDPELVAKVEKLLKGDIPEVLKNKKCAILGRHIATPNHESRRFISLAKENGLHPVFFEFHDDKFTPENVFKHSLGQLHILTKRAKSGDNQAERITIIDFHLHSGKKLRDIKTMWGEPLIDFHRKLFVFHEYKARDLSFYDASEWFKKNGTRAVDYYENLIMMFTCFGILFENFLTSKDSEGDFSKNVVLPALEKVLNLVGVKPLIVPLEPLELETDNLWYHHLPKVKTMIPSKKA